MVISLIVVIRGFSHRGASGSPRAAYGSPCKEITMNDALAAFHITWRCFAGIAFLAVLALAFAALARRSATGAQE
jgi:hypothetical protein